MSPEIGGFRSRQGTLNSWKVVSALIIAILSTFLYRSEFRSPLSRLEDTTIDWRLRLGGSLPLAEKIIIIEIDRPTLLELGTLPLDSSYHERAVRFLSEAGALAVAFDFALAYPTTPDADLALAEAMKRAENVYLGVEFAKSDGFLAEIAREPLAVFKNAMKGWGHVHHPVLRGDSLRKIQPRLRYRGKDIYSLGVKIALDLEGADESALKHGESALLAPAKAGPLSIPLDGKGAFIINWPGPWKQSYRVMSYRDVVAGKLDWAAIKDSVCLIGVTAPGVTETVSTPYDTLCPPVAVDAAVLRSIVSRKWLKVLDPSSALWILWGLSIVVLLFVMASSYLETITRLTAAAIGYIGTCAFVFKIAGLIIPMVLPLCLFAISLVVLFVYHQIANVLEEKRLMKLVTKDALTGLYNYDHFKVMLKSEIDELVVRRDKRISMLMADIDHFKSVNDTFGHPAGDEVIKAIAQILRQNCRSLDIACRYGGEEFILLLLGAPIEEAGRVAEKIRRAIQDRKFVLGDAKIPREMTASFGVASYYNGESIESFIRRADRALYKAKEGGRNLVCRV